MPDPRAQSRTITNRTEAASEHWDMPKSAIRTGTVDHVLPLTAIGPAINELVRGRPAVAAAGEP